MAEGKETLHLNYIKQHLLPEIVGKLEQETVVTYEVTRLGGLDGFLSILYNIKLHTRKSDDSIKERFLIAKFMKDGACFRGTSKSYTQFVNEIYIYGKVLPAYENLRKTMKVTDFTIDDWVPHVYIAKIGYVEGLSTAPDNYESVLVLDNLRPYGYTLGPRDYLNRDELLRMCEPLGQYHAMSYILRLCDEPQLKRLCDGIVPLPFVNENDPNDAQNVYRVVYRLAFDRFFDYFDRKIDSNLFDRQSVDDLKLIADLQKLRTKYFAEPTWLLERIRTRVLEREEDKHFGTILHGDFNRNNVLFRYEKVADGEVEGERKVVNVKIIDFQGTRFGTPCVDLSFYMYMNTPGSIRDKVWMEILKHYHTYMYRTLETAVKNNVNVAAEKLEDYSFEKFYAHFKRYAFHGVMICVHFLPWMLCSEEECAKLSDLFANDRHGEEFRKMSIEVGGDEVNLVLLNILRHASKMGYMDDL